jgi:transposase InsO family protein
VHDFPLFPLDLPRRQRGLSIPDLEHRRAVARYFTGLVEENHDRLHSTLGYITPAEHEALYARQYGALEK